MREYDQIAAWFTRVRNPEVGISDLAAFVQSLSPHAKILDLGCGDGIPISQYLFREKFDLVGLDSSQEMIKRYRAHLPTVPARCERAQEATFKRGSFDAVVAWGVLFHLSETDQAALIANVAGWLKPGGRFLFTSGDEEGEAEGEMNGRSFTYISLGASRYRSLLESAGMCVIAAYSDSWENHVYIAQKTA